ncbi:hypothetical protein EYF80_008787 [Liparis tanakae]|uniref:Uncharacterized protein n=1 Tax=Liparis tanakae TaxID=230148 RepID=A0A4Z2ITI5_9TELE|nr:hypothetical protein EYF80_008787 [Liparis tanakae]
MQHELTLTSSKGLRGIVPANHFWFGFCFLAIVLDNPGSRNTSCISTQLEHICVTLSSNRGLCCKAAEYTAFGVVSGVDATPTQDQLNQQGPHQEGPSTGTVDHLAQRHTRRLHVNQSLRQVRDTEDVHFRCFARKE